MTRESLLKKVNFSLNNVPFVMSHSEIQIAYENPI